MRSAPRATGQTAAKARHAVLRCRLPVGVARACGASANTTCAFAPPKPKELTPASARPPFSGQAVRFCATRSGRLSNGMFGLGSVKFRLGGIIRWRMAKATLISPATPAAASRWPMLVLTEPIKHVLSLARPSATTAPSAFASIASPSDVPVP